VLLTCSSSATPSSVAAASDRVNITVNYGVPVTSRGVGCFGSGTATDCAVESMLTIDEPGTNTQVAFTGYGPGAAVYTCGGATNNGSSALNACASFNYFDGTYYDFATTAGGGTQAQNAYQGFIPKGSATSVTFYNVPAATLGNSAVVHIYRVTNVRVTPGSGPVIATVSSAVSSSTANNGTTLSFSNNGVTVGTPATSLTTSVTPVGAESLCVSPLLYSGNASVPYSPANLALLSFKEAFTNAFKAQALPISTGGGGDALTSVTTLANGASVMGKIGSSYTIGSGSSAKTYNAFNSESMTIFPADGSKWAGSTFANAVTPLASTSGPIVGIADSGTRLHATFTGVDKNTTYYVSINNVGGYSALSSFAGAAADNTSSPYAVYVGSSTTLGANETTAEPINLAPTAFATAANNIIPVIKLPCGAASSTGKTSCDVDWEVTNDSGSGNTFTFAVYAVYSSSTNPPTPGNTATVTLGYSPTNGSSTTTPVGYTAANIPRFLAPSSTPATFFNVVLCQTDLLFPYITNVSGYETGIAISNTAMDPFGTAGLTSSCNLYFYGTNQPAAAITFVNGSGVSTMAPGAQIANTASGLGLVNFSGYAIAVCNFQYAHGFAFVQTSKQTLGMGYLPLVMNTTNRGQTLVGESFSQ